MGNIPKAQETQKMIRGITKCKASDSKGNSKEMIYRLREKVVIVNE